MAAGRDYERFARLLSAGKCAQLHSEGYVIVDGMMGASWAKALHGEAMAEQRHMKPHTFQFGNAQFHKPHIYETELHDAVTRARVPEFSAFFARQPLARVINRHVRELALLSGEAATTIKLQCNAGGGGCFPHHYDNAGRPNNRQLTCLVYLNPHWKEGDGGELELMPFLRPAIRIPPTMDRAVLFLSDRVLHRVLPSVAARCCFTIWIDGSAVNADSDVGLSASHLLVSDASIRALCASPRQVRPV
jgi:hypothetical protein